MLEIKAQTTYGKTRKQILKAFAPYEANGFVQIKEDSILIKRKIRPEKMEQASYNKDKDEVFENAAEQTNDQPDEQAGGEQAPTQ